MLLTLLGALALLAYPMMILADALGHGLPDANALRSRVAPAVKGMTDDGVPWVAGK